MLLRSSLMPLWANVNPHLNYLSLCSSHPFADYLSVLMLGQRQERVGVEKMRLLVSVLFTESVIKFCYEPCIFSKSQAGNQCCHFFWCFNIRSDVVGGISDVWCFGDNSDVDWTVVFVNHISSHFRTKISRIHNFQFLLLNLSPHVCLFIVPNSRSFLRCVENNIFSLCMTHFFNWWQLSLCYGFNEVSEFPMNLAFWNQIFKFWGCL